jgi:hypothetical protein
MYNYNSSNLEETRRTATSTKAIGLISTILSGHKFTRKPVTLKTKTKIKTKMLQPSQNLQIIAAETTSCQRSPRMTKRRCFSRIGC